MTHSSEATSRSVLTLPEAAEFLRIADSEVESLAIAGTIPGRRIGTEWRFLKAALEEWLRATSDRDGKAALLALAGAFKEDPHLEEIVEAAYRQRRRAAAEARR
jgi:excisionase family DNA binding protein